MAPLAGGANNRVALVRHPAGPFLLKVYFRHPGDPRDRLGAEYGFLQFAFGHGLACVPRPYAASPVDRAALYEFIPGRRLSAADVTAGRVGQAAAFFRRLNEHRDTPGARRLPPASEACFSLAAHLDCVARRVARLGQIGGRERWDRQAARLVAGRLAPAWEAARRRVERRPAPDCARPLPPGVRRISPSDFGFHNALLVRGRALRFIDFEYAGWDDPAKTVCDFFCQVAVPAPWRHMARFATLLLSDQAPADARALRDRIRLLFPLYQIKWCCIVLNDFLPADAARRRFARGGLSPARNKARQLAKAEALLDRLAHSGEAPL